MATEAKVKDSRYLEGQIYTIRSHQTELVYVGSTIQPLSKRIYEHRQNYKAYLSGIYHYTPSFKITKFEDHYIELHEDFSCGSKKELIRKMGKVIRSMDENCVNKYIPGRTSKEYYDDNKDKISMEKKLYYEANKKKMTANHELYRKENKEQISIQQKIYYEANKEHITNQQKLYRAANKVKYTCICGSHIAKGSKARHEKSKKHIKYYEDN